MGRNYRRSKKMAVVTSRSIHVGAVILMFFAMVILNLLASSSSTQVTKDIGRKRRVLASLDEDLARESARWEDMLRPESLDYMVRKHGLAMIYPRDEQVVRMDDAGVPLAGQRSVLLARAAAQTGIPVASATARSPRRASSAKTTRRRR